MINKDDLFKMPISINHGACLLKFILVVLDDTRLCCALFCFNFGELFVYFFLVLSYRLKSRTKLKVFGYSDAHEVVFLMDH